MMQNIRQNYLMYDASHSDIALMMDCEHYQSFLYFDMNKKKPIISFLLLSKYRALTRSLFVPAKAYQAKKFS